MKNDVMKEIEQHIEDSLNKFYYKNCNTTKAKILNQFKIIEGNTKAEKIVTMIEGNYFLNPYNSNNAKKFIKSLDQNFSGDYQNEYKKLVIKAIKNIMGKEGY